MNTELTYIDLEKHYRHTEAAAKAMAGLELPPCNPARIVAFFEDDRVCLLEEHIAVATGPSWCS
jgi:hypothetical protein